MFHIFQWPFASGSGATTGCGSTAATQRGLRTAWWRCRTSGNYWTTPGVRRSAGCGENDAQKNSGALDGEQLIKRWWLMVDGKIQRCPKWRLFRSRTWLWWEVTIEKLPQDHSKPSSWSTWWLILRAEKSRETILATKPFETRGCTFAATCVNNIFGSIWSVGVFFWRA